MFKSALVFEFKSFLAGLALMSRLPMGAIQIEAEHRARSPIWYPLVGLVLGLLLTFFVFLYPNHWPVMVESVLLLIIWVAFSGALHLDGLADTADAWVGGMGDRQRTLDIMKDPSCGPMAVVVLVLALLLKFVLIFALLDQSKLQLAPPSKIVLLLLIPMLARVWLLPALVSMDYARAIKFDTQNVQTSEQLDQQGGMASEISKNLSRRAIYISFTGSQLLALLILIWLPNGLLLWLAMCLAALGLFVLLRWKMMQRLGGYTGDLLGASVELQELLLLLLCLLFCLL